MDITQPLIDAPMVEWSHWWASQGWCVFPIFEPVEGDLCACGVTHTNKDSGKHPRINTGFKGGTTDPDQITAWWAQWPTANIGATPPPGWVVVDIDGPLDSGVVWPDTRVHSTAHGEHRVYADPEGRVPQTSDTSRLWTNVDTRVNGKGYVVLPPSWHREGVQYTIVDSRPPDLFPYDMLPDSATVKGRTTNVVRAVDAFSKLLAEPTDSPETGDGWLTRVAGYIAHWVPNENAFMALLGRINLSLDEPLSEGAIAKKVGIYRTEQAKQIHDFDNEDMGWLVPGTHGYLTQIILGGKVSIVPWSDFTISVQGVVEHPDERLWIIDLHLSDGTVLPRQHLSSSVLASTASFRRWLMGRGATLHTHSADKRGHPGERLTKLMSAQSPPVLLSTDHYGWHADPGAYVVPDGVITPGGLQPHSVLFPDIRLSDQFRAVYGFVPPDEAVEVFRQVLTFQDPTACAVVGSWMIMLILRGQWSGALLPALLVEAFSESGKTTFFEMITELLGCPQKGGRLTTPTIRDSLRGHANGVVWLDDIRIDDSLQELVRAAVTGGEYTLKDMATGGTKRVPLRSTVILSGEGIDFGRQKAVRDRFVEVELKDPTGRRSVSDPSRSQWLDVLRLKARYGGDLSAVAGGLVQAVLEHTGRLNDLPTLLDQSTRAAQGHAVVAMGSKILTDLLGDDSYERLVDAWLYARSGEANAASTVVLEVIPQVWRDFSMSESHRMHPPVYRDPDSGCFWVNTARLASEWRRLARSDRERELTSQDGIERELKACGAGASETRKGLEDRVIRYRELPLHYSRMAYERAIGEEN